MDFRLNGSRESMSFLISAFIQDCFCFVLVFSSAVRACSETWRLFPLFPHAGHVEGGVSHDLDRFSKTPGSKTLSGISFWFCLFGWFSRECFPTVSRSSTHIPSPSQTWNSWLWHRLTRILTQWRFWECRSSSILKCCPPSTSGSLSFTYKTWFLHVRSEYLTSEQVRRNLSETNPKDTPFSLKFDIYFGCSDFQVYHLFWLKRNGKQTTWIQHWTHPRKPRGSQSRKGQFLKYRTPSEARPRAVRPKADLRAPGDIILQD